MERGSTASAACMQLYYVWVFLFFQVLSLLSLLLSLCFSLPFIFSVLVVICPFLLDRSPLRCSCMRRARAKRTAFVFLFLVSLLLQISHRTVTPLVRYISSLYHNYVYISGLFFCTSVLLCRRLPCACILLT